MTTTDVRQSRANVTRIIAATLCFDMDPPVIRSLQRARDAAGSVYEALVMAGIITGTLNGAAHDEGGPDSVPLFPVQAGDPDPES